MGGTMVGLGWLPVLCTILSTAAVHSSATPPDPRAILRARPIIARSAGCASSHAHRLLLRGGGGGDGLGDQVTPTEIMEIGSDVLKMWEVSYKEAAETAAASANCSSKGGLSEAAARTLINDELHAAPQPAAAAGSAVEGPHRELQHGEGLSAQGGPPAAAGAALLGFMCNL